MPAIEESLSCSTPTKNYSVRHNIQIETAILKETEDPCPLPAPANDDEGMIVRQKVKRPAAGPTAKLNSNIGLDNSKYIMNINLQNDFRAYAHTCKRLLKEVDTPGLIMIGCGRAITRLLKIVQICGEYFPGLH